MTVNQILFVAPILIFFFTLCWGFAHVCLRNNDELKGIKKVASYIGLMIVAAILFLLFGGVVPEARL